MKRALFKVMGGSEQGLGHIRRSLALHELAKDHFEILFHCNEHPSVLQALRQVPVRTSDLQQVVQEFEPSVILWDQRDTEPTELSLVRQVGTAILALDYFDYESLLVDRVLNLYHHNRALLTDAYHPERFVEGHQFAIVRPEFLSARENREVRSAVREILISFGGGDPAGHTAWAIRFLLDAGYGRARLTVVLGPDANLDIGAVGCWLGECVVLRNVSTMPTLMQQADLACTSGGTTLLEACYCGLPTLVFPQTTRERDHAQAIALSGAAMALDLDLQGAAETLESFRSPSRRAQMSEQGQALVDGQGVYRIVEELRLLSSP